MIKLGINIDHVATLREVRKAREPDILQAAQEALKGGADSITVHLREDERHIKTADVDRIRTGCHAPLNLEMSTDETVVRTALRIRPDQATLVPERRLEITTECGLDLPSTMEKTTRTVRALQDAGITVSLFVDPDPNILALVRKTGADRVEIHTGEYAFAFGTASFAAAMGRIITAGAICRNEGLIIHAGHGLNYDNLSPLTSRIPDLAEVNIGHSIISRAVFTGLSQAVADMKRLLAKPDGQ